MPRKVIPGVATAAAVALLTATLTTHPDDAPAPSTTAPSTADRSTVTPVAARQSTTTASRVALDHAPLTRGDTATRTVTTAEPFSMIGLTWRGAPPESVSVRHRDGGGWSSWTPLDTAGAGPGPAHASEPMWTGRTRRVQVRATSAGHDVSSRLDLVAIRPAETPVRTTDSRSAARPPVVTRAEWGADESLMTWPPEYVATTKAVIVHHTAETNDYTCDQSAEIVRGIYYYHAVELGWGDIGYQALVDKCGTIFEGRTDGLDNHVVGGHTRGFNGQTFGVAMLGSYDSVEPAQAMLDGVGAIAGWKLGTTGISPHQKITLISGGGKGNKYPQGTSVTLPAVFAHRDVNETVCPGAKGYAQLPAIRDIAAAHQSGA